MILLHYLLGYNIVSPMQRGASPLSSRGCHEPDFGSKITYSKIKTNAEKICEIQENRIMADDLLPVLNYRLGGFPPIGRVTKGEIHPMF